MQSHKLPLYTPFGWPLQMAPVTNIPCHLKPTEFSPPILMKSQYRIFYPETSMYKPLILDSWMVMPDINCSPWHSRKKNYLRIFISEFSDFSNKSIPVGKISLLQDFSSSTWSHFQILIYSNHSLHSILHTLSYYLENEKLAIYTGGNMNGIYCYLYMIGSPNKLT